MTLQPLLKVIDKEDYIEIIDSYLPIGKNLLFRGRRKDLTRKEYDRFKGKHISGVSACDDIVCIIADVTIKEKGGAE